jgi:hypothetical protein
VKLYLKVVVLFVLLVGIFGVLAPELISNSDTVRVCLGFVSIIVILPIGVVIGKSIYTDMKEKI